MPSFDIVSEVNWQEVDNGVVQAQKEVSGRYDFKGSRSVIEWDKKTITILGDDEYKMNAMKDILQTKLHRRGVDIKSLQFADLELAGGKMLRQKVEIAHGINREMAKEINKFIKDSRFKVQSQIMDDKVKVTSKSIDELQATMASIREYRFNIPLQFSNMRP